MIAMAAKAKATAKAKAGAKVSAAELRAIAVSDGAKTPKTDTNKLRW